MRANGGQHDREWDDFVAGHEDGWLCQMSSWGRLLEKSFPHIRRHLFVVRGPTASARACRSARSTAGSPDTASSASRSPASAIRWSVTPPTAVCCATKSPPSATPATAATSNCGRWAGRAWARTRPPARPRASNTTSSGSTPRPPRSSVRRPVRRIILETTGEMRELRHTVTLEQVTRDGCVRWGGCPRDVFHLWREAWLRRVEPDR